MNFRIITAAIVLSTLGWVTPAPAALVTYVFTGHGSATITGVGAGYYANVDYKIDFSIDGPGTDLIPGNIDQGGFGGGQARLTLTNTGVGGATGITNALSTNITGIRFERIAPTQQLISLVNPSDFSKGALTGSWASGGPLVTVNAITPFNPVVLPATGYYSGPNGPVVWNFAGGGSTVAFNGVTSFIANNGVAAVPEPSALVACVMGVSALCLRRRKKKNATR